MNISRLREAEMTFLDMYPGGFSNESMAQIAKKHKPEKMREMARTLLAEPCFADINEMTRSINKIICASSMVSVFEKPRFRDFSRSIDMDGRKTLVRSHYNLIHGDQEKGFSSLVDFLDKYRIAKWTYVTACLFYSNPETEVFVKPTTCRGVIAYFELEGLFYRPCPEYGFYVKYRKTLNEMKENCSETLHVDNGAFSGFLMMSLPQYENRPFS